jgi:hypothetical protein
MSELEQLISNTPNTNTAKTYKTSYNRLIKNGLTSPINEIPNLEIIEKLKEVTDNAESRNTLLTLVIKLKRLFNRELIELSHYQIQNNLLRANGILEKKNDPLLSDVSYNDLQVHLAKLYNEGKYVSYIVNYLIVNYGVRTQDVNVIVTNNKKDILPNDNYLLVKKSSIIYIRDNYKTHKTYGKKEMVIKNKQFVDAVKALMLNNEPLLVTRTGQRLSQESQGRVIQDMTYNQIGEGRIFKIIIDKFKFNEAKLKELAESRGTSLQEIMKHYTTHVMV